MKPRRWPQVLWECGGTLAAPAITGGVIHKALAFIAPKLVRRPSIEEDHRRGASLRRRPVGLCVGLWLQLAGTL